MREYYVYIMTNLFNEVLYTGVTNNLYYRVQQHKRKHPGSFTARYNVNKLVYFEVFDSPYDAITREKQIKAGPRQKKIDLVDAMNPDWRDLFDELIF